LRGAAFVLAALVILGVVALAPIPAFPQEVGDIAVTDVRWSEGGSPVEVGPGSFGAPLTITLLHTGKIQLRYGTVTLLLPDGFESANGDPRPSVYIPAMQPGQSVTVTFRLNLAEALQLGTYQVQALITGTRSDDTTFSGTVSLPVRVLGTTDLRVIASRSSVVAGTQNTVELSVQNAGTGTARNLRLEVSSQQQISVLDRTIDLGDLEAGKAAKVRVRIYIPPNLAGASISLALSVSYLDPYLNQKTVTKTVDFVADYPKVPNLLVEASASELVMQQVNDVTLRLSNTGTSSVRDLTVLVSVGLPIIMIGSDGRFHIDSIGIGESVAIPLRLYLAETTAPSVPVTLTLSYLDDANQLRTETRSITFFVSAKPRELLSPLDVRVSPTVIYSGMVNNVTLVVRNVGGSVLNALTVELLQSGTATWISDAVLSVESLQPNEERRFSVGLFVPSDAPTSLTLNVGVRYYGPDNVQKSEQRQLGVLVKGIRKFEIVDYTVLPERPAPGQTFSVTFVLVNTGTARAIATSVSVDRGSEVRSFGQSRTFLGDVAVNTPTSVTFTFVAPNATRPGPVQIPLLVAYRDEMGEQHTERLSVTVPIGGGQSAGQFGGRFGGGARQTAQATQQVQTQGLILPVITAVVGLGVGLFVGRRFRR